MKSEIEYLEITMDKAIIILVLNSLNSLFIQFLDILSYKEVEKKRNVFHL